MCARGRGIVWRIMATCRRLLQFGIVVCAAFLLFRGALYHLSSVSLVGDLRYASTAPNEMRRSVNYHAIIDNVDSTESTNTDSESSDLSKGSQGYLLVVDYKQQLTGAFLGFYHLASLTSLLNLSIVEPYVQGTGLQGAPVEDSESQVLKLSSFYDMGHLRDALRKCANSDLMSFEDFVSNASRNVVLVSFLHSLKIYGEHFPTDGRPNKIVEIENATSNQLKSLRVLNTWVSFVSRKESFMIQTSSEFRVSRVVLVDARPLHLLPLSDLVNKLGSVVREQVARFGSATVILDRWRDIQLDLPSSYFYFIPEFKWRDCDDIDTVKHSEMVINAADKFRESLNKSRPVVGIHIRGERLLLDFKGNVSHYIDCLLQIRQLLRNGTIANVDHGSVHVLHDLGRYGSTTCENREWKYCRSGRSRFLSALNRYFKKKVVSFDPGNFRPSAMQGAFAAFVEQEYLSTVDVLVTVARGGYQDHTVQRFLKRSGGRRDNLYRICHNPPPLPECYPNC